MKLKIGKIPYANLFPIFYVLEKECDCSYYEFVEGVPSTLNKMLRDGEIDVSPSSSIEYLKNPSLYQTIDSHSISSKGPVESILFFSKKPIENLSDSTIYVSSQSETSIALLDIIVKKFYGVQCVLQISENPESLGGDAWLLIGDDALRYGSRFTAHDSRLIYDLGELWHEKTGLPFVFALWIVRKDVEHRAKNTEYRHNLLDKFVKDLNMAKNIALKNLSEIAKHSPMKSFMSEEEIILYWNKIDYDFTAEHKKGLEIFYQYLKELSYF
jgi:chorismate dehydratase